MLRHVEHNASPKITWTFQPTVAILQGNLRIVDFGILGKDLEGLGVPRTANVEFSFKEKGCDPLLGGDVW